jgi:hypothetical protein
MSNLHRLPVAIMVERAPPGYSNRVRQPIEGASLDELDAEVKAAGGEIKSAPIPAGGGLRRGRRVASAQRPQIASWYVIPDSALSE